MLEKLKEEVYRANIQSKYGSAEIRTGHIYVGKC